uniref:Uncharacterized protein n=1 Tax=Echeneis naucrates TaxID=173247 RepID=A0A665UAU8_ECHNA
MVQPENNETESTAMHAHDTHKLQHVPVKDVVIGEALSVEKVPEKLPQIRVVRLVIEPQGTTHVQVCGEFSLETEREKWIWRQDRLYVSVDEVLGVDVFNPTDLQ